MRHLITRTFNTNSVTCLVYENGKVSEVVVFIPSGFNTNEQAERYIRKNNVTSGKLISVEKIDKISSLYGMEESVFLSHATPFNERSKETRNLVTKNVASLVGELLYMTPDHKLERTTVLVPKDVVKKLDIWAVKNAPTGGKGITVENIREVSALYGMTEQDFIKYGRPMIDNQHFVIK